MLSQSDYIRISMEQNLFWARIMKEHAIFIEGGMMPNQQRLRQQAKQFKQQFSVLFSETIRLSNDVVPKGALFSGQFYTRYTEAAEQAVMAMTGIDTDSSLTQAEYDIQPAGSTPAGPGAEAVQHLNTQLLNLTRSFATFKSELYNNQTSCRLATYLYPADLAHVLQEALHYISILSLLGNQDDNVRAVDKAFWTENMAGHAKSMRGLFDPTEVHYIDEADRFAQIFDALHADPTSPRVPSETKSIAVFKADTTQSLLECRVKAIMNPLYTDHMLREANHFSYQLEA